MRTIHSLNLALLAGLVGLSIAVYPDLPSQIPVHFGGNGEADEWAARTAMRWMLLPLVATGVCIITYFAAWLSLRDPRRVNVPDRNKLLSLPHERQMWVLQGIANPIYLLAAVLTGTMCLLQYGAYLTAMTGSGRTAILGGLIMALMSVPFMTVGMLVSFQRRMDQAWQRHLIAARG